VNGGGGAGCGSVVGVAVVYDVCGCAVYGYSDTDGVVCGVDAASRCGVVGWWW